MNAGQQGKAGRCPIGLRISDWRLPILFNPHSAMHHVGCMAAQNPTWFWAQSAIRNFGGRPYLPELLVSPEEYFFRLRGWERGLFESGADLTRMALTVASPIKERKSRSRAPSVTLTRKDRS